MADLKASTAVASADPAAEDASFTPEDGSAANGRYKVYEEQGRHLKKRLELKQKLEKRRQEEAKAADPDGSKAAADAAKVEQERSVLAAAAAKEIEEKIAEEKKEEAPREKVVMGKKMTVTTEGKMDASEQMRLNALIGTGKADKVSAFTNQEGVTTEVEGHDPDAVLVFMGCKNCDYTVSSMCTKIFVDKCADFILRVNEKVITQTIEVYKVERANFLLNQKIGTFQVEQCEKVNVIYGEKEHFGGYVVWAGCHLLRLQVGTGPDPVPDLMRCDFNLIAQFDATVNKERTQFKVWYGPQGKLVCDKIIRLANGFPTTAREDADYERRQTQHLKGLADRMGITVNREQGQARVKPNAPCPCGSGKKYKKCCKT